MAAVALFALAQRGAIDQDLAFHDFADTRALLGVPNFGNVASNLPFLLFGAWGALRVAMRPLPGALASLRPIYLLFFVGSSLVAFGSGWYHLAPTSVRLGWDRAPMTLAFVAFFAMIVGEQRSERLARHLVAPLALGGLGTVLFWRLGDADGSGDLRPYLLVQFLPLLLLPLLLALYPARLRPTSDLWGVLALYVVAKLFETGDRALFESIGVSGHTLKHLVAGAGVGLVLRALARRRPPVRTSTPSAAPDEAGRGSA